MVEEDPLVCSMQNARWMPCGLRPQGSARTELLWHKEALKPNLPLEVEGINKAFETKEDYQLN